MGRVDIAVEVGLDHAVDGETPEAADDLGVVADLLGAQHDALAVVGEVLPQLVEPRRAQGERRRRGEPHRARAQHGEHPVLDHLGVGGEGVERAAVEAGEDGVGDVADARLQGEELAGKAPVFHLVAEELEDVAGDLGRLLVDGLELGVAVGGVGEDDGRDLVRVALQVGDTDAVRGPEYRHGLAVRGQRRAVVDVVHALEPEGLPRVHLEDDAVGEVEPGLVVADGGGRDETAVGGDPRHLDDGEVEVAEEPLPDHLGDVAQVHVDVVHLPGIDLLARDRVDLIGHAQVDAVHGREGAVEVRAGGGSRPHAHGEMLVVLLGLGYAVGEGLGHGLGVAGTGEAAHADRGTF